MTSRLSVATIITRLEGGAGALALSGILAVGQEVIKPLIITGSGGRLLEIASAHGVEVIVDPVLSPDIAPISDLRAVRRLTALLDRRRPRIVHTHCAKGGAIGRIAGRRAGVDRIVHTYHGFPFHQFQSPLRRRAYVAAERRLGRLTDVALCTGTGVAVEAIRRGLVAPERVRTIGVTVDPACRLRAGDPQARLRARAALGISGSQRVVGAVGRLTYQKAPDDFVTALAALAEADVTGVWIGSGELAGPVRGQAAAAGRRLVLTGDRDDVADLLPALDVFVLPSRYEGLPTAVAEAMAAGIPVVATAVNAVADLVEPGVTGLLVPAGRPERLAAAIGHLLAEPGQARRMSAAAAGRIGARYQPEALADALLTAYQAGPAWRPAGPASLGRAAGEDQRDHEAGLDSRRTLASNGLWGPVPRGDDNNDRSSAAAGPERSGS